MDMEKLNNAIDSLWILEEEFKKESRNAKKIRNIIIDLVFLIKSEKD